MWPTPQDYNEAIQNPALSFGDAELRCSLPETSHLGIPRPVSGSFASVYHMQDGGGEWAVRCFLHHFADQEQRYCHISQFLGKVALQYTVDFEFLARGIRVPGQWFPVLKMDWVERLPLTSAVETALNSQRELVPLDESFVEMCLSLTAAGIADGDVHQTSRTPVYQQPAAPPDGTTKRRSPAGLRESAYRRQ